MRAARGSENEDAGGMPGAPTNQQIREQMDDRVECRHCGRKFNEQAADRHIPLCEKKSKETMMKAKGNAKAVPNRTGIGFKR